MPLMKSFKKGKVSIVTPCYNGERFLDRYFNALLKQTYNDIEIIIVNDGKSTDNSENICLNWKSRFEERGYTFQYVLQKSDTGVAGAINEGLPYVTGEFLIWPDCDDTLMAESIEKRVNFLNSHFDYAMVRSDFISVYDTKPDIILGKGSDWADVTNEYIFDNLIFDKTYVTPGCYMVRSSVIFERIPSGEIYWENRGGQNWQLLLPCSYMNKTGYIDEPLYKYFIRKDSHSHLVRGDKYSSHKKRISRYNEILFNVISDFQLLSDNERAEYLRKIHLKYIMIRLNLAFRYNIYADAKDEIQNLESMNIKLSLQENIMYHFCLIGISGFILRSNSLLRYIYAYFHRTLLYIGKKDSF